MAYFLYAIVAFVLFGALLMVLRRRARRLTGFRDWIRNPATFYERIERDGGFEDPDPGRISDNEIRSQVRTLLKPHMAQRASAWLEKIGPRAVPFLVAAANDPRFARGVRPKGSLFSMIPADWLLRTLGHIGDPATLDVATPFLTNGDQRTRQDAALAIGLLGQEAAAGAIRSILREQDDEVREHAFIGIQRAIQLNRASEAFLSAIFHDLNPFLTWGAYQFDSIPARAMLAADRERAIAIIADPKILTKENPALQAILRTLLAERVEISPSALSRLEKELGEPDGRHETDNAIGLLLNLQARQKAVGIESRIHKYLDSPSTRLQEFAAEALAALRGAFDPAKHVNGLEMSKPWEQLSEPQRFLAAILGLEGEVNNGGFSQYFFNSAGDHWPDAVAGLRAIGAAVTERLLRAATECFGPRGPSVHRVDRQHQLSSIVDECEDKFGSLDDEFFKDEDRRDVRAMLYVADHAEDFMDT